MNAPPRVPQPLSSHPRWGWTTREFRLGKRISLTVVTGWLVLAALTFGMCGLLHVPPRSYLLVLLYGGAAVLAQVRFPAFPRGASLVGGAVVAVGWAGACQWTGPSDSGWPALTHPDIVWVALVGAVWGYIAGTLTTGVLLIENAGRSLLPLDKFPAKEDSAEPPEPAAALAPTAISTIARRRRAVGEPHARGMKPPRFSEMESHLKE